MVEIVFENFVKLHFLNGFTQCTQLPEVEIWKLCFVQLISDKLKEKNKIMKNISILAWDVSPWKKYNGWTKFGLGGNKIFQSCEYNNCFVDSKAFS